VAKLAWLQHHLCQCSPLLICFCYCIFSCFDLSQRFVKAAQDALRASPTVWYITCHPSKFGKTSKNQSPTVCQSDLPKFSGCLPRCRARIFAHANPTAYPSSRVRDSSSRAVEEFSSPSRVTEARLLLYFFPPPSSRYLRQHRPPSS